MSILASKFDHIYLMDADSYPLMDVDDVFGSDLYSDIGYLLHSDYWPRYISPHYYEIIDVKLGERVSGNPNDGALMQSDREGALHGKSTESGQIFVHKSSHLHSLLLDVYYNLYGPNRYFTLLTMHGPGEGDKDAYVATAELCGEKYYQTKKGPSTLGYYENDEWHGVAMVQPEYQSDLENPNSPGNVSMFAIHPNFVKANTKYMLGHADKGFRTPQLSETRYFGPLEKVHSLGLKNDPELRLFDAIAGYTCEWVADTGYLPTDWEGEDVQRLCSLSTKHAEWLRNNS